MNDDDHIREVYAYFGLAVYFGQVLEHGIVNAMVILRMPHRDKMTKWDVDVFMDRQFENTLGKLIKNLQSEIRLPIELEGVLRDALKTRNWLCHDYFRERALELASEGGRDKMLAELVEARELLEKADKTLTALVQPLADRYGMTKEACEAEFRALCREADVAAEQGAAADRGNR
jgi:hypothetical protein